MTLSLSDIPAADERPVGAHQESAALRLLAVKPRRRTVLRVLGVAALSVGGTVLSWGTMAKPAWAETGPGGLRGWDVCRVDYAPDADTSGAYVNRPAACNSGTYRGSTYCRSGWHRTDTAVQGPATIDYNAVSNRCWSSSDGRNSWRWAAGGVTYRCSDGNAKACASGGCSSYNTVCRAAV